ncbi:MAG: hypothetical protein JO171_17775 [Paludibacterium sp.]|uniref:hypothetical protein n=1 Tax=Paludibacterium sp. TaxID=1917523 RepID=UPI0025EBDC90|nr:hypothetical protein [Paludibacterium sp.]MBV8049003.1 hypothetical protein [Paludibacterium sp.]MBV8647480.1 hypothetical protein [Paludibacterium sp.]
MRLLDLLPADGPSNQTRLTLGSFEFQGLEVPEAIAVGAHQQTAVHKLVGGGRIVDVLGVEYDNLTWSGWLVGTEAQTRAKQLEALRDTGKPLLFSLDHYALTVLIGGLTTRFEHAYRLGYSIDLLVLGPAPLPSNAPAAASPDDLIDGDIGSALGLSQVLNDPTVTGIVTDIRQTVDNIKAQAGRAIDQAQQLLQKVESAQNALGKLATEIQPLDRYATLGGLLPGNPVASAVERVVAQLNDAARQPTVHQLQSVLGRLQKNLAAGPVANGVQTVTTGNTSLQRLAADAYGDQSMWPQIAAANSLSDPLVIGIQQIRIPWEQA